MALSATRKAYIAKYKQVVINSCRFKDLLPSVMMAQAIIESRDGQSTLAAKYNNHFGIKADSRWTGKSVNMATGEVFNGQSVTINANFRAYDSDIIGFKDRVNFLYKNQRYKGVFGLETAQEQAQELQRSGYATDPNYANKIMAIVRDYELEKLDSQLYQQNSAMFISILAIGGVLYWYFALRRQ